MRIGLRRMRTRGWSLLVAMLLLGGFVAPSALSAEDEESYVAGEAEEDGPLKECLDAASKDYNTCLHEAGTRWSRLMCDVIYESDAALCWAEQLGKIRRALVGDEELN
jgi:hypothetical protein